MFPRRSALLATALLVAVVAAPAVTTPVAAGDVAFASDSFETHRGGTVTVPVSVPAGATARVSLQQTTNAVTTSVTVADGGDGRVVVALNTYTGAWSVRSSGDTATDERAAERPPLAAGRYEVVAAVDDSGGRASLTVAPDPLTGLTAWYAANETGRNASGIAAAVESGALEPAVRVNESGVLVLQLDAPGLAGVLAATPGENLTARFRRAFRAHGAFAVQQTNPTPERQPVTLSVLRSPGVRVVADAANETYFVVLDLSAVRVRRGDDRAEHFEFRDAQFEATAVVAAASNLTAHRRVERAFVAERRASVSTASDGRVHLFPDANQTVTGSTTVGTGRRVTVAVRGRDDPDTAANESFVRRVRATVRPATEYYDENRFAASLNLTGVPASDVAVDVRARNRSLLHGRAPGRVAPSVATVAVDAAERARFTRLDVAVTLSRGGFVVLHERTADGDVVGASSYLPPGAHTVAVYVGEPTNASAVVAVAHADANHNQWFDGPGTDAPYDANASATAALPPETTTTTPTPTRASPTRRSPASPASPSSGVPVPAPGFAPAALAVCVGFWLAGRARRR